MGTALPSQRLRPLQQLADRREDDAARQLLEAQRLHAERQSRYVELCRYREEYERQNSAASPQLLRNRQAFVERLREAERFQQQLVEQAQRPAEVAITTGFSDQAHFNREFRAFAGLTPGEYLALSPRQRHHVAVRSDFFKTAHDEVGRVSGTLRSTRSPR